MRRRLSVIAATAISTITLSTCAFAGSLPAFEFRGHHIGESIDIHFPYWAQGFRLGLPLCYKQDDGTIRCIKMISNVGGADIIDVSYQFFQGTLYGVQMDFYTAYFFKIRDLLTGKYGKPVVEHNDPVQNQLGAKFDNFVSEWKFREGVLKLEMRFAKVDTGVLIFENSAVEQEISTQNSQRLEVQGKKAF